MEWVETTGKTVEDAKDAALDQLGVDEQDAEFEVLEEPRDGPVRAPARRGAACGRGCSPRSRGRRSSVASGGAAAVGAGRLAPASAVDANGGGQAGDGQAGRRGAAAGCRDPTPRPRRRPPRRRPRERPGTAPEGRAAVRAAPGAAGPQARSRRRRRAGEHTDERDRAGRAGRGGAGLPRRPPRRLRARGQVTATPAEEGAIELDVAGDDLGLLIGPKGATLQAVQELSRSVLQRQHAGRVARPHPGRRGRLPGPTSGGAGALRPPGRRGRRWPAARRRRSSRWHPPDRKVVHDTVNEIDGVHTVSEGEDSRRRVVIIPD